MSFRLKELSQVVCLEQSGTGRENLKLISFSFISFVISVANTCVSLHSLCNAIV